MQNLYAIEQTAATLCALLQCQKNQPMASENSAVLQAAQTAFNGENCERIFMYNPDAIALWIYEKYACLFANLHKTLPLQVPIQTVYPPVTPVCFASMYTGLTPAQHGIQKYEKPILSVPTVFDVLANEGKKIAIVSTKGDSISKIFLQRKIDYFIYDTIGHCNDKALALIAQNTHDMIVLYNGNYDYWMHRFGPCGKKPIQALEQNITTCQDIAQTIKAYWHSNNTVLAFAPDHGCHSAYKFFGSHGINQPCDMQTAHLYGFFAKR